LHLKPVLHFYVNRMTNRSRFRVRNVTCHTLTLASVKKNIESIFFKSHSDSDSEGYCKARRKLVVGFCGERLISIKNYLLELCIYKIETPAARTPMNTA
jgi:hypothetical protein